MECRDIRSFPIPQVRTGRPGGFGEQQVSPLRGFAAPVEMTPMLEGVTAEVKRRRWMAAPFWVETVPQLRGYLAL